MADSRNWLKAIPREILLAVLLGITMLVSAGHADERQKPKDQKEMEGYSLGFQFGENLKKQGLQLDLETYISGLRDGLAGREPLMSREDIRTTISELQKRAMAARQREQQEKSARNLAQGKAFLDENKKKEGVTTLPSGLQYKVLQEGSGKMPKLGDKVKVHYKGSLIDGTVFDSSYSRNQPAEFGLESVIPGWTEAPQLMKEGAKHQLFIPPELAYGEQGNPRIGPNSTLVFEVELITVESGKEIPEAPRGQAAQ